MRRLILLLSIEELVLRLESTATRAVWTIKREERSRIPPGAGEEFITRDRDYFQNHRLEVTFFLQMDWLLGQISM